MTSAVKFDNVSFAYGSTRLALDSLSFDVQSGHLLLIIGHNGAGKSTLLKLLNGILRPSSGEVQMVGKAIADRPTSEIARTVGVTFQDPGDQLFAKTISKELQVIETISLYNRRWPDVNHVISMLNLSSYLHIHPYDAPFAVRKLVTFAIAALSGAPVLGLDEPTAGLSSREHAPLLGAISRLCREGRTLIVVSHDLTAFLPLASSVLVLQEGKKKFHGGVQELLRDDLILRFAGLRLSRPLRLKRYLGLPLDNSHKGDFQ